MAGITSGAWTTATVNGRLVLECDVVHEAADLDNYTLKTPANTLDPTRAWTLFVNTAAVTLDSAGLEVDIWAGYDDDFALASDNPPTVTSGAEVASAVMDDVKAEMLATVVDPNYTGTTVQAATDVAGHVNVGIAPYYVINLDGTSTLAETDKICHYVIVQ